jgi:MFS transporter, DHA1 family, multidrug resistance protein
LDLQLNLENPAHPAARLSFLEFVALMAAAMALGALAVDLMLPALATIGTELAVTHLNQLQWIVDVFLVGNGCGQLFYGPLADRFGRRPVLLWTLSVYILMSLFASFAASLTHLLWARLLQGIAVAASAVVIRSVIRDCYSGNRLASVTSTVLLVFLIAPVIAPNLGQWLLHFIPWQGLFVLLALSGLVVCIWMAVRLPETLDPAHKRSLHPREILSAYRYVLRHRAAVAYTLASTVMFGALIGYVSTVPQIFKDAFKAPERMGITFSITASAMAVGALINSQIVERYGMRRVSRWSIKGYIAVSFIHVLVCLVTTEGIWLFTALQALTMTCSALTTSNYNALAMQPMGALAGSAASLQGVTATIGGGVVAAIIGSFWSGSIYVLPLGTLVAGVLSLLLVTHADAHFASERAAH